LTNNKNIIMENPTPPPTIAELEQQLAELKKDNAELKKERNNAIVVANAIKGELNKTKYALQFAEKDRADANQKAENLAALLAQAIPNADIENLSLVKDKLAAFEKCHQSVEIRLLLWATNQNGINLAKLTQAFYAANLMRGSTTRQQQAAYQKAEIEANRLANSDLPPPAIISLTDPKQP
jgi:hypothetical protein